MKHLKIEGILEKRFGKINEAFEKARLHFQENDIRVFCVKMKKLAAFLRLANAAKKHGHPFELPHALVKLSEKFGAVRSLQMQLARVQLTLADQHSGNPEIYLNYLSSQILECMEDVSKHDKDEHAFKKEEDKLLKQLPDRLQQEAIQQYVRSEGDILEELLMPVFIADKSLHAVRKHLKNLLYIAPYAGMGMSELAPYRIFTGFEEIDDFTKQLGEYHDLNTALACLLTAAEKLEVDEDEKFLLRGLEQVWTAEREACRVQVYAELQKITASGRTPLPVVELPVQ